MTFEYAQRADGSMNPSAIHNVVTTTQHVEPFTADRWSNGGVVAGIFFSSADRGAHRSMEAESSSVTEETASSPDATHTLLAPEATVKDSILHHFDTSLLPIKLQPG